MSLPVEASVDLAHDGTLRRDPDEHKIWTFDEYRAHYAAEYAEQDIKDYWRECCRPITSEANTNILAGRRDPDEHKIWTFDEYRARYATEYAEQDIKDYWRECCQPITSEAQLDSNGSDWWFHEETCMHRPRLVLELKIEPPTPETPEVLCFADNTEDYVDSPSLPFFDFDTFPLHEQVEAQEQQEQATITSEICEQLSDDCCNYDSLIEVQTQGGRMLANEQQQDERLQQAQALEWVSTVVTEEIISKAMISEDGDDEFEIKIEALDDEQVDQKQQHDEQVQLASHGVFNNVAEVTKNSTEAGVDNHHGLLHLELSEEVLADDLKSIDSDGENNPNAVNSPCRRSCSKIKAPLSADFAKHDIVLLGRDVASTAPGRSEQVHHPNLLRA